MRALLAVCLLCAACEDEVPIGSHLERTRVLAVWAHPTADVTRAWPRPGEETTVSWLVVGPGELPALTWHLEICAAGADGVCHDAPFLVRAGAGTPEVTFVAPDADRLFVTGVLTPAGEPETALQFELLEDHGEANHHPVLGEVVVPTDCVAPGAEVALKVTTAGADREPVGSERETLRLSFFTTAGKQERQYAVVEGNDPRDPAESEVPWTAPEEEGEVDYVIVVRDLRGGVDFTSGTLCVRRN